jgi:hypothetical protein
MYRAAGINIIRAVGVMRDRDAIYQDILRCARRRIERADLHSDLEVLQIEKAHLALIPKLLNCRDERRHRHYLEVDQPRFVRHCRHEVWCEFELFWMELAALLPDVKPSAPDEPPIAGISGVITLYYESGGAPDSSSVEPGA